MSVENPLVSVIIPVYNTEEYLYECLDCLINQTLEDIEIICVEDKSGDNSLEILKEYSKKDDRIILMQNSSNQGQSISRNKGLAIAKGEYVTFLDSDDMVDEDAYEQLYKFAQDYGHDLVVFNAVRFNDEGVEWPCILHSKAGYDKKYSKTNVFEHKTLVYDTSMSKFIKKDLIDDMGFEFLENTLYEDLLFSMEVLCASECLGILPDVNYHWRVRTSNKFSVTQAVYELRNLKDRITITNKILDIFRSSEKNSALLDTFYKKVVEIDILQSMNELDRCEEEYINIMDDTVRPFAQNLPGDAFNDLNDIDKLKYEMFFRGDYDSLIKLVGSERSYKKKIKELNAKNRNLRKKINEQSVNIYELRKKNDKLKGEVKEIKTTQGWFAYKTKNIYQRISKKI